MPNRSKTDIVERVKLLEEEVYPSGTNTPDTATAGEDGKLDLVNTGEIDIGKLVSALDVSGYDITGVGELESDSLNTERINNAHRIDAENADNTGNDAVDSVFSNVLSDADEGDIIEFGEGTYRFEEQHIIQKTVHMDARDAVFIDDRDDDPDGSDNSSPYELIGWRGSSTDVTTLASATKIGDVEVDVANAGGISEGDYIQIHEDLPGGENNGGVARMYQNAEVLGINNGTLTLAQNVQFSYSTSATVSVTEYLSPIVIGLTIEGNPEVDGTGAGSINFTLCRDTLAMNNTFQGYGKTSVKYTQSWGCLDLNTVAHDPRDDTSQWGEGIQLYQSEGITLVNPKVYKCRRGIDLPASHNITVIRPHITDFNISGLGDHEQRADSVSVTGGFIGATNDGSGGTRNFNVADNSHDWSIRGTRLFVGSAGIAHDGKNLDASVKVAGFMGRSDGESYATNISGNDAEVSLHCDVPTLKENCGLALISGGASRVGIGLKGSIDSYNNPENIVWVRDSSDVEIEGNLRVGDMTDASSLIRIDSTDDSVYVSLRAEGSNLSGASLIGARADVTFRDCHLGGVGGFNEDPTSITLLNSEFEGDVARNPDKLHVSNCTINGGLSSSTANGSVEDTDVTGAVTFTSDGVKWDGVIAGGPLGGTDIGSLTGQDEGDVSRADGTDANATTDELFILKFGGDWQSLADPTTTITPS